MAMPAPSRLSVARALHGVFAQGARISDRWNAGLGREDASLALAILGLTLRHWGRLRAYVTPQLNQTGRGLPLGSEVALAMGLAQLAWLDGVADHAGVHESVELVADREVGFPPHRGLVNAILRRAAKDRGSLRKDLEALPARLDRSDFTERVLRGALADHGAEGEIESLWSRMITPPRTSFRELKPGSAPKTLLADESLPSSYHLAPDATFPRDWLERGEGMVQDRSSQALMNFSWNEDPKRILDVCAAPGGKTSSLRLRYPEASIIALEKDPHRAGRLVESLKSRRFEAQVVVADAEAWMQEGGRPFDLILLDAPCSGSGTLQKHPELNWLGDRLDLARLTRIQRSLLKMALTRLAPGGLLIYAVCSWLPEEGAAHREAILGKNPDWMPAAIWPDGLGAAPGSAESVMTPFFRPHPVGWQGEGFQAFALTKP
jgi:16S rRNA (cytosine967-C5)-methyltransferase